MRFIKVCLAMLFILAIIRVNSAVSDCGDITVTEELPYVDYTSSSQTFPDPPSSSSKPDLFIKSIEFGDSGRTHYYSDEDIQVKVQVGNVGTDVDPNIDEVMLRYVCFRGEYEDVDYSWSDYADIPGYSLGHNDIRDEDITLAVRDEEAKFQYYACIDYWPYVVDEADESNNCSNPISILVRNRPDLAVTNLTLDGGETSYEIGNTPFVQVTIGNTGGEPFGDVPVRWYLDGVHYDDDNIHHWNITHNDIKNEDINLPDNIEIGTHVVKACYELDDDQDNSDSCMELSFEVTPALDQSLRADVNGDGNITSTDALLVNRKALGLDMSQTAWIESPITGDANCDGQPTSTDSLLISRKALGMSMAGTAWCVPE